MSIENKLHSFLDRAFGAGKKESDQLPGGEAGDETYTETGAEEDYYAVPVSDGEEAGQRQDAGYPDYRQILESQNVTRAASGTDGAADGIWTGAAELFSDAAVTDPGSAAYGAIDDSVYQDLLADVAASSGAAAGTEPLHTAAAGSGASEEDFLSQTDRALREDVRRPAPEDFGAGTDDRFDGGRGVSDDDAILMEALGYDDGSAEGSGRGRNGAGMGLGDFSFSEKSDLACAFAYDGHEYRSERQAAGIKNAYEREQLWMYLRLGGTAVFGLVVLIFDLFGKKFSGALSPVTYPTVNILISLQFLMLAAAFSCKQIWYGLDGIFKGRPGTDSFMAVTVVLTVLYDVILAIIAPASFMLYNLPAAAALAVCVVSDQFDLWRERGAFGKLAEWDSVCTLEPIDDPELEAEVYGRTRGGKRKEGKKAYRLRRSSFAENYFHRTNRVSSSSRVYTYVIAGDAAFALIMFFINLASGHPFTQALNAFIVIIQFTMPVFAALASSMPFWRLTKNQLDENSLIFSEADTQEYASVDTVVFDESDVFSEGALRLSRVVMCDQARMDQTYRVMTDTAAICQKVGGTIATAFQMSLDDYDAEKNDIRINRVTANGIDAVINGDHYLIGKTEFLKENGILVYTYREDEHIRNVRGGSVLHIAVNDVDELKIFFEYKMDDAVALMIGELANRNVSTVIRCLDPNVTDELVSQFVGSSEIPVRVVRARYRAEENTSSDGAGCDAPVEGGIVANGSEWVSVTRAADACGLYKKWSQQNMWWSVGLLAASVVLSILLFSVGVLTENPLPSIYVTLFQILTLLPAAITSKLTFF